MRIFFCLHLLLLFAAGNAQDSTSVKNTNKRYVFDVNAGPILGNAISNFDAKSHYTEYYSQVYSQKPGTQICYGFGGGTEVLFGHKEKVKNLIGLTYTLTHSDFMDDHRSSYLSHYYYERKVTYLNYLFSFHAIDLSYSFCRVINRVKLSLGASYSYVVYGKSAQSGYTVSYIVDSSPYGSTTRYDSTVYNKAVTQQQGRYLSIKGKMSYDLKVKNASVAFFILANWAIHYRLPYVQAGLQWYPFRKMR